MALTSCGSQRGRICPRRRLDRRRAGAVRRQVTARQSASPAGSSRQASTAPAAVLCDRRVHPGGPFRDNPKFAAETRPARSSIRPGCRGQRLQLRRAARAPGDGARRDPVGRPAPIRDAGDPGDFAAADGQASRLDGAVQLYAAQSPAFLNGFYNPVAVTADFPSVSAPQGISLNNAFGRPWFTYVPDRSTQPGYRVGHRSGWSSAGRRAECSHGGIFAAQLERLASRSSSCPVTLIPG